jgi:di/tricarboxylate transporter
MAADNGRAAISLHAFCEKMPVLFVALGILPLDKVITSVDWNVVMMIAGTMGIVHLFIQSKIPSLMADYITDLIPNVKS